jgi:hypothetical protein
MATEPPMAILAKANGIRMYQISTRSVMLSPLSLSRFAGVGHHVGKATAGQWTDTIKYWIRGRNGLSSPMAEDQWESFKVKLEETHQWPCPYTFKCIVRAEYYCELDAIKEKGEHSVRQSSNGKYLSLTLNTSRPRKATMSSKSTGWPQRFPAVLL